MYCLLWVYVNGTPVLLFLCVCTYVYCIQMYLFGCAYAIYVHVCLFLCMHRTVYSCRVHPEHTTCFARMANMKPTWLLLGSACYWKWGAILGIRRSQVKQRFFFFFSFFKFLFPQHKQVPNRSLSTNTTLPQLLLGFHLCLCFSCRFRPH